MSKPINLRFSVRRIMPENIQIALPHDVRATVLSAMGSMCSNGHRLWENICVKAAGLDDSRAAEMPWAQLVNRERMFEWLDGKGWDLGMLAIELKECGKVDAGEVLEWHIASESEQEFRDAASPWNYRATFLADHYTVNFGSI
jgi:hypothetical protein